MAETVTLTATTAGTNTGPFSLYHTAISPAYLITSSISRTDLLNGVVLSEPDIYNTYIVVSDDTNGCNTIYVIDNSYPLPTSSACINPIISSVTNPTGTDMEVSFYTGSSYESVEIIYTEDSTLESSLWTSSIQSGNSPLTVTASVASGSYYFRMKQICSASISSSYSSVYDFQFDTGSAPPLPDYYILPLGFSYTSDNACAKANDYSANIFGAYYVFRYTDNTNISSSTHVSLHPYTSSLLYNGIYSDGVNFQGFDEYGDPSYGPYLCGGTPTRTSVNTASLNKVYTNYDCGDETGILKFQYTQSDGDPTRFLAILDGVVEVDSGYFGDSIYAYGAVSRSLFTAELDGITDLITGNPYPNLSNTDVAADGYPNVYASSSGADVFYKSTSTDVVWVGALRTFDVTGFSYNLTKQVCRNYLVIANQGTNAAGTYTGCNGSLNIINIPSGTDQLFCVREGTLNVSNATVVTGVVCGSY